MSGPTARCLAFPAALLLAALLWTACVTPAGPRRVPSAAGPAPSSRGAVRLDPPVARQQPHRVTLHGDTRVDPYHWLRNRGSKQVVAYLRAENAFAGAVMQPTEALQRQLYEEIVGRIQETDTSAPYKKGAHYYYERTQKGKQYPMYCRKLGDLQAPEQIILDMNALAEGRDFLDLGVFEVSADGNFLAYSLDTTGFREYTLAVKDLRTGSLLAERIHHVESVAWASNSRTFFYTVEDKAKRPYRLCRHELGASGADPLVYEEADEKFRLSTWRSRSGAFVFAGSFSHTTSEVRFVAADNPKGQWRRVAARQAGHEYYVSHRGDRFYIRTNDQGRNFRIVSAPVATPDRPHWQQEVPHRQEVMLDALDVFQDYYVLLEREAGLPHLRVTALPGGSSRRIELDEAVYDVGPGINEEFAATRYRFDYESPTTPPSVFDHDTRTAETTLVKRIEVLGDFDPQNYRTQRIHATAADGTRIPISLAYRRKLACKGPVALLLVGYGAYGYAYPPTFSHARLSLLDRGLTYAIAHVRGGGELGKPWHDQGRMEHKTNTFSDFVAAAQHLIAEGYTSSRQLAIRGDSAGGLLIGAVVNSRPELFRVAILLVPFVDVLNTMLDASLPLTVGEYEEWGDPRQPDAYFRMKGYCPYTNIKPQAYPVMLVRTSLNDSQVMYWEPAKYVARLRATKTDHNLLLLHTDMDAGHGGSSGRYDYLKEVAFDYAFLLTQL